MYYLELIQRFWDFNQKRSIGSPGISMYLYLLKIGFDNDRYDFKVSDVVLSKELGLTNKTIKSTKEKLRSFGLIQFETKNGFPGYYRLRLDYPLEISASEKIRKEKSEAEKLIQQLEEFVIPATKISAFEILPKTTDRDVEAKLPQTTPPATIQISNNLVIPNFEEFMEYARTLENYEVELDSEIQAKYQSWVNNGWKNSSERLITNWRSSLKSALPFMKNSDKIEKLSIRSIPSIRRPKS
jgi:hypothetical protein